MIRPLGPSPAVPSVTLAFLPEDTSHGAPCPSKEELISELSLCFPPAPLLLPPSSSQILLLLQVSLYILSK